MKIKGASFLIGAVSDAQYPDTGWPEIALCGRSNVGKSSLINRFINRRGLARTSSQPGKTQQLNYYAIESEAGPFYFVDLPGYGYAKVSKAERVRWGEFIEAYLARRETLQCVLHILDIRHLPSADDISMHEWMVFHGLPVQVVATKSDKISKGKVLTHTARIAKALHIENREVLAVSSETGQGVSELKALVRGYFKTPDITTADGEGLPQS